MYSLIGKALIFILRRKSVTQHRSEYNSPLGSSSTSPFPRPITLKGNNHSFRHWAWPVLVDEALKSASWGHLGIKKGQKILAQKTWILNKTILKLKLIKRQHPYLTSSDDHLQCNHRCRNPQFCRIGCTPHLLLSRYQPVDKWYPHRRRYRKARE